MRGQLGDHRPGQCPLAHVGQRLGVDHVVAVAGAQHLEEVQPALRAGGGEGGEVVVAELGADAVLVLVAGAGVVDADPGRRAQPGPQHVACLVEEGALALVQQPTTWRLEIAMPMAGSWATRRGTVTWPW